MILRKIIFLLIVVIATCQEDKPENPETLETESELEQQLRSPTDISEEINDASTREVRTASREKLIPIGKTELAQLKKLTDDLIANNGASLAPSKPYLRVLCKLCSQLSCRPKCVDDSNCHSQLACVEGSCIHLCSEKIVCGKNTHCLMQNHRPKCECKPGFSGNPKRGCQSLKIDNLIPKISTIRIEEPPCQSDKECPYDLACRKGTCVDKCVIEKHCAKNALCRMDKHKPICTCKPGFTGNPRRRCTSIAEPPCQSDKECPYDLACRKGTCVDICVIEKHCAKNALCRMDKHKPICTCKPGFTGNPRRRCTSIAEPPCQSDKECPYDLACRKGTCIDICVIEKQCAKHALCRMDKHKPICTCKLGFTGNPHRSCTPIAESPCRRDKQCPNDLACRKGTCVDICVIEKQCAENAVCRMDKHKPICTCMLGFTGNPHRSCTPIAEVPSCIPDPCGVNAVCTVTNKKPICKCKPTFIGNPWVVCRKGCKRDSDCEYEETCIEEKCTNVCKKCGKRAICEKPRRGKPICKCPPGYRGNPYKECIPKTECRTHKDCPSNKPVCNRSKCENPCLNACGINAICKIERLKAVCSCRRFHTGDPFTKCWPPPCLPGRKCPGNSVCINEKCVAVCTKIKKCGRNAICVVLDEKLTCVCKPGYVGNPQDECRPSEYTCFPGKKCPGDMVCFNRTCVDVCNKIKKCGKNAICIIQDRNPRCVCLPGYEGVADDICLNIKNTCNSVRECPGDRVCYKGTCVGICNKNKRCGKNAICIVLDEKPRCICKPEYVGDPEVICHAKNCPPKSCGPNTECENRDGEIICKCLPTFFGDPLKGCRRGCQLNSDCKMKEICIERKCQNPCKLCAKNAICEGVKNDKPICKCLPGYRGNPYKECSSIKECNGHSDCPSYKPVCNNFRCENPCDGACGDNAICKIKRSKPVCSCPEFYTGNPSVKCWPPHCNSVKKCPGNWVCFEETCVEICNKIKRCGKNAICIVLDKKPRCICKPGYVGDPENICHAEKCPPKSCGPNTECEIRDSEIICKCLPTFFGNPLKGCRRGCQHNSDCKIKEICIQEKCQNQCELCARNAICTGVTKDKPICKCLPGYRGNPYKECTPVKECNRHFDCPSYKPVCNNFRCENPCDGACGDNAICKIQRNKPVCSCPEFYTGNPSVKCWPPPCNSGKKCPGNRFCFEETCVEICNKIKRCGKNALCIVLDKKPRCICKPEYVGDPEDICHAENCPPKSCGPNTKCKIRDGEIICKCLPTFFGNPSKGCQRGCQQNSDCKMKEICTDHKCQDPCELCAKNAICTEVTKNKPICKCLPGYRGNPYKECTPKKECNRHSDCPSYMPVCNNFRCENPCDGACGDNAICKIQRNKPVCSCPEFYTGNPFAKCWPPPCFPGKKCPGNRVCFNQTCVDICNKIKKCGENAICIIQDKNPRCICETGYVGVAEVMCHNILQACNSVKKCPGDRVCVEGKCVEICKKIKRCGKNAICVVLDKKPRCICKPEYVGDPEDICHAKNCPPKSCGPNTECENRYGEIICKCLPTFFGDPLKGCRRGCQLHSDCKMEEICIERKCQNPCNLCGKNAICKGVNNKRPSCKCLPGFSGNPYKECRLGECQTDTDCPKEKSLCKQFKCKNPCDGACGINTKCVIRTNRPICHCLDNYIGNPLVECRPKEQRCPQNKCGPNTLCLIVQGKTVCKCLPNFSGTPREGCRRQCKVHKDCKREHICIDRICQDGCKLCAKGAICRKVVWKDPICKCPPGANGDPYKKCNRIGDCNIDADCPKGKPVCQKFKCEDPCRGACGIDALCKIIQRKPICSCRKDHIGDPLLRCFRVVICPKKLCGPNTLCILAKGKTICQCLPEFTGDPSKGCRRKCKRHTDCSKQEICIEGTCIDACELCGKEAICDRVPWQNPICKCRPGYTGNANKECKRIGQCFTNADCPKKKPVCNKFKCENPCDGACGINTVCHIDKGQAKCFCQDDHIGDPFIGCKRTDCLPEHKCKCLDNRQCPTNLACVKGICRDVCSIENKCGRNAVCHMENHKPTCKCKPGYVGNPHDICKQEGQMVPGILCRENVCGSNAVCKVVRGKKVCKCLPNFSGNPWKGCSRKCKLHTDCSREHICIDRICQDGCELCAKEAICQKNLWHETICNCPPGSSGNPYRKCFRLGDCNIDADCPERKPVCKQFKCENPCDGACGINALCKITQRKARCSCPKNHIGDPLVQCKRVELCLKNLCGANTICVVAKGKTECQCLPQFTGDPWKGCRRKCNRHTDCIKEEICIEDTCTDACESCGKKAICERIAWRNPICKCPPGYTGNAYKECKRLGECLTNADCPEKKPFCNKFKCENPCKGACGINTVCHIDNNQAICFCKDDHIGDPLVGCKRVDCLHEHQCKCTDNRQCPGSLSCVKGICVNVCFIKNKCGENAVCQMENHKAICKCKPKHTGNPYVICKKDEQHVPDIFCQINTCGPNTICKIVKGKTVCKCSPNSIGNPQKGCRRKCDRHSDCSREEVCIDKTCTNACKLCGKKAICERVPSQRPICKCPPGFSGNPFKDCKRMGECVTDADCFESKPVCKSFKCQNPCDGACGINALCEIERKTAVCSCPSKHTGDPLVSCRRKACLHEDKCQCLNDQECPENLSCVKGICVNTCHISKKCGTHAVCYMENHVAICICKPGFTGDPSTICVPFIQPPPCGPGHECKCSINSDCPSNLACMKGICIALCDKGTKCGAHAVCIKHKKDAVCVCESGFSGDPLQFCHPISLIPGGGCLKNSCGKNAICTFVNNKIFCKCKTSFIGNPWKGCKPECKDNSDCSPHHACIKNKCQNTCNLCGQNAFCEGTIEHKAICKCLPGYIGNPYKICTNKRECSSNADCPKFKPICNQTKCLNPCDGTCGINALCYVKGLKPICYCTEQFTGNPNIICTPKPCTTGNCGKKCVSNQQCPSNMACVKGTCINECITENICGINAICRSQKHKTICSCKPGYTGDPNIICRRIPEIEICRESPCGPNTLCVVVNKKKLCSCLPTFIGNPWQACHPECKDNRQCSFKHACIDNTCQNPCKLCSNYHVCRGAVNHSPICECLPEFYNECMEKPECTRNADCPRTKPLCKDFRCENPCDGFCGVHALCDIGGLEEINPICYCPQHYTGDPFVFCQAEPCLHQHECKCLYNRECPKYLSCVKGICADVCSMGKKCGKNAACKVINHEPTCTCLPGLTGNPLQICEWTHPDKPCTHADKCQCRDNHDCPIHLSCVKGICVDVCSIRKTCGVNAVCKMESHQPVCFCKPGYTGDPLSVCRPIPSYHFCSHDDKCKCTNNGECPAILACVKGICVDVCSIGKKCGVNAMCKMEDHKPVCICKPGQTGDPLLRCRQIPLSHCVPGKCKCTENTQCLEHLACVRGVCVDTCLMGKICGKNAVCRMQNHHALCVCEPGTTGDPNRICKQMVTPITPCLPGIGCGPACVNNRECPDHLDCEQGICIDKCSWQKKHRCVKNAVCKMKNHKPSCMCEPGFTGYPTRECVKINNPFLGCSPEFKCGVNAICTTKNEKPVCTCEAGFTGNPSRGCKKIPEKITACPNGFKCGVNAFCTIKNRKPVCICEPGFTGDPSRGCKKIPVTACPPGFKCGVNAFCIMKNRQPMCTCELGFTGDPSRICKKIPEKITACRPGFECGVNAVCTMKNRKSICICKPGFTGDPSRGCKKIPETTDLCYPSPCGANAVCVNVKSKPYCKCLPNYIGDPSEGCYHSCEVDFDCNKKSACIDHKCESPCKLCGKDAKCEGVKKHRPICKCPSGYVGNPYKECKPKPECQTHAECPGFKPFCNATQCENPCDGACGIKAICKLKGIKAVCSCPSPLTGDPTKLCGPPGMRKLCKTKKCGRNSECEIQIDEVGKYKAVCKCLPGHHKHNDECLSENCSENEECPEHKACINSICGDPCEGRCGIQTSCKTTNHKPICSCLPGFEGDPDVVCKKSDEKPCVLLKICPKK